MANSRLLFQMERMMMQVMVNAVFCNDVYAEARKLSGVLGNKNGLACILNICKYQVDRN
jgi:biotin-(acetyl-CoA carboxylase) ligase